MSTSPVHNASSPRHGGNTRSMTFVAILFLGMTALFLERPLLEKKHHFSSSSSSNSASFLPPSPCDEYRKYPFPEHHSGLPYLGDVFASHDASIVHFIAIHRGGCREEYKSSDAFAARAREGHRFVCVFSPGDIHVISEYVHPTRAFDFGFVIQCIIPNELRYLIQQGQESTALHVDLHAIEDLETNRTGPADIRLYPSMVISETPAITNIPVCHPIKNLKPNQFQMTAFTRIKSQYALSHREVDANSSIISPVPRLLEWMDYHRHQGFDHFVIYDSDEEPHGGIEKMLQPYIQSGLVTYRWFPLSHCWVDWGSWKGYRRVEGQLVASLAALHRMSIVTQYFAHMDVDEFFVPLQQNKTVLDTILQSNSSVDAFLWKPTLMAPCNGTTVSSSESVLTKWKCLTEKHYADVKLIMRASRMQYFFIHYPVLTVDGIQPNSYLLNDTTEGFLAHYRADPRGGPESTWRDMYSGLVVNDFTKKSHFMDDFIQLREQKKGFSSAISTK